MMGPLGAMQENNPLVQALGKLQQNTLGGGGVTLGNQQAQQDYAQQMADALARMRSADSQQGIAESLMSPEYVPNSGLLGSIAMMAQAAAGKKMAGRASKEDAAAREAYYKGQSAAEQEKARREAEKDAAERERRQGVAGQMGLSAREALEFAETGKVPQAVRNVPMMTDQGLVNVNPYTGEYSTVQPQGQQNVRIDPALANNPEAMAAIRQDMASGATGDASYQVQQGQRPLMPYRDPAEAQRQAAADARANAQLGLAYRAADRADAAEARAQQAAKQKAAGSPGVKALGAEAANKVGLYENALRSARKWFDIVAEKDASGKYTGGYNNFAAMSPEASSLLENALRAKLRAESGANIPDSEIEGEMKRYTSRFFGSDKTDLQNATALLNDLVTQRKRLLDTAGPANQSPQNTGRPLVYNPKTGEFE